MIKVLVVDDSALVRKLLGQVLAAEPDFEVEFARDGVEALEYLATGKPDVITLDVQMPRLDGLATLDRVHFVTLLRFPLTRAAGFHNSVRKAEQWLRGRRPRNLV